MIRALLAVATLVVATLVVTTLPASAEWRLVYEHDAEGKKVSGNKATLKEAIRNGKPVRVYFGGGRVEHASDAYFLTIFQEEVFAQIEEIHSQHPSTEPLGVFFREPGQRWRAIIGTNGQFAALMDGGEPRTRSSVARWFIEE